MERSIGRFVTAGLRVLKLYMILGSALLTGVYLAGDLGRLTPGTGGKAAQAATAPVPDTSGKVVLFAGPDGHFRASATIGGRSAPMLVDTGATVVALSYEIGRDLGLVSRADRFDRRVSTANGAVGAKQVMLRDVRVGSVRVQDVPAVVLAEGAMDGALLGMSFLSRLRRFETAGGRMTLER